MSSKKGTIQKVMNALTEVIENPPMAPEPLTMKAVRKSPKTLTVKKTAKKMDGKLVSAMEDYEVKYLAQKHGVTQKAVKEAVAKVGHSRSRVEAELKHRKAT